MAAGNITQMLFTGVFDRFYNRSFLDAVTGRRQLVRGPV